MRPSYLFATPPASVSIEDCIWYHSMDIPGTGAVVGPWDLRGRFMPYIGNVDLTGKSVLDIGTASGFLSFSAEKAGAREVVSFDIDTAERQHLLPFKEGPYYRDHATWVKDQTEYFSRWKNGYWLAHHAFNSEAKVVYGDIYNIPPELGIFDVVIFCAVLEHMSDPIRAMASVARHVGDTLILGVYTPTMTDEPIAWFLGAADRPQDNAIFWAYSIGVYREILGMLGFTIESIQRDDFLNGGSPSPRTTIVARIK